jgi:hexosaminidase
MKRTCTILGLLAACAIACACPAIADDTRDLALMPMPTSVARDAGHFALGQNSRFVANNADALKEAEFFAAKIARSTGFPCHAATGEPADGNIQFILSTDGPDTGAEGYSLEVTPQRIRITARQPAGLFYGGQTLLQLLPADVYRTEPVGRAEWSVPCVRITDTPRFAWRGLMLDVSRHFLPKADVLRFIDTMSAHKFNRMHFHLVDDQGWRLEIKKYPLLTERSAWRNETLNVNAKGTDNVAHGGYYTQDDAREIVAYAARRHIVVVPEIEMPGHAQAWISAYPSVGVFPEQQKDLQLMTVWGVSDNVLAPRPSTMEFCKDVLTEVMAIFPSPWIHTGGDEAPRKQWKESEEMGELMQKLNLSGPDQLQTWFTNEISTFLDSKGRHLIGWDEVLDPGLAKGAVIMAWRGEKNGTQAAQAGHDIVMCPSGIVYLNGAQGPKNEEPITAPHDNNISRVVRYEPVPPGLPPERAGAVIGAEATFWSEHIPSIDHLERMAYPRSCAMAEATWCPAPSTASGGSRDLGDFLYRMAAHERRLDAMGVEHRELERRIAQPDESGTVHCLWSDAVLHGWKINRSADERSITEWKGGDALATWGARLAPSSYTVYAEIACPEVSAGTPMIIDVNGVALPATVPATADWNEFKRIEIGHVKIDHDARVLVVARPAAAPKKGVMNLRSIDLVPEGAKSPSGASKP